jgi:hypothetical protein
LHQKIARVVVQELVLRIARDLVKKPDVKPLVEQPVQKIVQCLRQELVRDHVLELV